MKMSVVCLTVWGPQTHPCRTDPVTSWPGRRSLRTPPTGSQQQRQSLCRPPAAPIRTLRSALLGTTSSPQHDTCDDNNRLSVICERSSPKTALEVSLACAEIVRYVFFVKCVNQICSVICQNKHTLEERKQSKTAQHKNRSRQIHTWHLLFRQGLISICDMSHL